MTPNCQMAVEALQRFRDGALPPADESRVLTHVFGENGGCATCQGRLADLEALGELLTEQRAQLALPADFASKVMQHLPAGAPQGSLVERLAAGFRVRRQTWVVSLLAVGVAATLLVVFAPGLRSADGDRSEEAAENEAEIHQLDVSGTDRSAVVLESSEGNTVIWLVPNEDQASKPASPHAP